VKGRVIHDDYRNPGFVGERRKYQEKEKEIGGTETAKSYRPIDWVGDHVSNE